MHSSSSGRIATLSMRAWAEKAQPDHVGKIIMVIGMLLTLLVQVGVLSFGRLPPPQIMEQQPTRYPAASVLIFTAILRFGALASITVILPFASAMSETSGHGARDSGYLLGFYGVGALMGTVLYSFLPIQQLTLAYHAYGCITLVGNLLRGYAGSQIEIKKATTKQQNSKSFRMSQRTSQNLSDCVARTFSFKQGVPQDFLLQMRCCN